MPMNNDLSETRTNADVLAKTIVRLPAAVVACD